MVTDNPSLLKSSRLNSLRNLDSNFASVQETVYFESSQILHANPALYLEHIWTDTMNIARYLKNNRSVLIIIRLIKRISVKYHRKVLPVKCF